MATAEERGFAFKDLPMVIDPASAAIEVGLAGPEAVGDSDVPPQFAAFGRVEVPFAALPFTKSLGLANIYSDAATWEASRRAFAYGADGVLRMILYREEGAPEGLWATEEMPEEFTGSYVLKPSVRIPFDDPEAARKVAQLAAKIQRAVQMGSRYPGLQEDAQALINTLVESGEEPRLVEVADPIQSRTF